MLPQALAGGGDEGGDGVGEEGIDKVQAGAEERGGRKDGQHLSGQAEHGQETPFSGLVQNMWGVGQNMPERPAARKIFAQENKKNQ